MPKGEIVQGQMHYGLLLEVLLVDKIFGLLLETLHSDGSSFQGCNG